MKLLLRGKIPFEVHHDEALSNAIKRENDFFEVEILEYLATHHKQQKTIIDVGANIGNHSVYFANFLEYTHIVAIEPLNVNYDLLKVNMEGYDNIGLINAAASATSGELPMFLVPSNYGASHVHLDGDIWVRSVTIDRLMLTDVTLMKIDVEGHEPAVLEGANETIARCKPLILIEDWEDKYAALLPDYELLHGWDYDHTFLYGPK